MSPAGELHAIIGPNGAGKTTLIGQLAGEIAPNAGRIHFDGADITALPVHRPQPDGPRALVPDHVAVSAISPRSTMSRWRCRRMPAIRSGSGATRASEAELREPARAALERVGLGASREHHASPA